MKILLIFVLCMFLTGCQEPQVPETFPETALPPTTAAPTETTAPETAPPDPIGQLLREMSTEERVGQLFLARCDDTRAIEDIGRYHLGGFVLFGRDFENQTPASMREKLASYQAAAKIPLLLAVDEEGGTVTRVSSFPAFRDSRFPSPRDALAWGGPESVLANEEEKCRLLSGLGLNVNLGPVCDIALEPSAFMYRRSLGLGPEDTGEFAADTVELMRSGGMGSVLKHFPGYGNNADTHAGIAVDSRSLAELEGNDLIPFASGIEAGCGGVLVSHTIVEAMDKELPASLSPAVHRYLREKMSFDGVIITDDLVMEAITQRYGAGEAAVLAVLAGNDLLCSTDYITQYEAVLDAVESGRIKAYTLENAVRNVLEWKLALGLIG